MNLITPILISSTMLLLAATLLAMQTAAAAQKRAGWFATAAATFMLSARGTLTLIHSTPTQTHSETQIAAEGMVLVISVIAVVTIVRIRTSEKKNNVFVTSFSEDAAQLRTVSEGTLAGIYLSENGKFSYVNTTLASLFGYAVEELVDNLGPLDLVHPDDRPKVSDNLARWYNGDGDHHSFCGVRKNGTTVRCNALGQRVENNGRPAIVGTVFEAGMSTHILQDRQRSDQVKQTIYNTIPDAIICTDANLDIVSCNHAVERVLGYSQDELIGVRYHKIIAPEMFTDPAQRSRQTKLYEKGFLDQEIFYFLRKNGAVFPASFSVGLIKDEEGEVLGLVGTIRDISPQQKAERALQRYTQRLEILRDIDQAILGAGSQYEITDAALTRIRQLIPCKRANITLFDVESQEGLVLATSMEDDSAFVTGTHFPLNLSEETLKTAHQGSVNLAKYLEHSNPDFSMEQDLKSDGIQTYQAFPLEFQGETIGTLNLGAEEPDAFDHEHVEIAQEVADSLAVVIQHTRLLQDTQNHAHHLELLNKITWVALETQDMKTMLQELADRLGDLMGADGCYISLWDEGKQVTSLVAAYGALKDITPVLQVRPGETHMIESVLNIGDVIVIEDIHNSPLIPPHVTEELPIHSLLGLPLIAGGTKLGAALIAFNEPHHFDQDEIRRGEQTAAQIALALSNAHLVESERQRRREAEILREVSSTLNASLDLQQVLTRMLEQLSRVVSFDSTSVMLLSGKELAVVAQQGFQSDDQSTVPIRLDTFEHIREVIEQRHPVIITDTRQDPRWQFIEGSDYILSWMGIPLITKGEVIGLLNLDKRESGLPTSEEIGLAMAFANQAATAIDNARLYEKSQEELTERRRAQEALQISEERYERAISAGSVGVWDLDLESDNLYLAPNLKKMLGYQETELEDNLESWVQLVHPGDRMHLRKVIDDQIQGRTPRIETELRMVHTNGDTRWFFTRGTVDRENGGKLQRVIGTLTDITKLKQTEADLRMFKLGIERSDAAIFLTDIDGKILHVNPAFEKVYGYSAEEAVGKTPSILKSGLITQAAYTQFWDKLLSKQVVSWEKINKTKDGQLVTISGSANPILDENENTIGFLAIQRDITEQVQREREREVFVTVAKALRSAANRQEMFPVVLDHMIELLQADGAAIALRDGDSEETVVELARGKWEYWSGERLTAGEGISGHVIATGEPYADANLKVDPLFGRPDLVKDISAVACVPLKTEEKTIGALWVGRKKAITNSELSLLDAISDIAANAIHRATLHEQTSRRLKRLTAFRTVDLAISASLDLKVTLNVLLEQAIKHLEVDAAAVLLLNPHMRTLEFAAGHGFLTDLIQQSRVQLGQGLAGSAALEQRRIYVPDIATVNLSAVQHRLRTEEQIRTYIAVPLSAKGRIKGVLELYHRSILNPDVEWFDFLETLAGQAAIAADNAELFNNLQRSNLELTLAYDTTLEGWSYALELRDQETEGHTQRVTEMTIKLAREMGISEEELIHVRRGALLHDIGKMGIPDEILFKPGPLNESEWEIMRQHPVYSYELLSPIPFLRQALDIPYCHHEKWDGTGYPRGLKGEQIPLAARVFAIVDVWDALLSDRPYREAWSEERVYNYLGEQQGIHFDPQVVDAFFRII